MSDPAPRPPRGPAGCAPARPVNVPRALRAPDSSTARREPRIRRRAALTRHRPLPTPGYAAPAAAHSWLTGNSKTTSFPVSFLYTPPNVSSLDSALLLSFGSKYTLNTRDPSAL